MSLQDVIEGTLEAPCSPRPRRRWDLVAAWAVILGPALGVLLWLGLRQRVGDLEERLVREANATFARPVARPVHVDPPTEGSFGDAVVRHLPAIQAWSEAVKEDSAARAAARDVVEGKRPVAALPPAYRDALRVLSSDLDGLLAGTRAARADLPLATEPWVPCDGTSWTGYQAAALLAGLRAREALADEDAARAAEVCLDGLALGRDAAVTSGLIGHMVGVAVVKRLWAPCGDALRAVAPGRRGDVARRLRAIRDAFPSVGEMLRVEFLSINLLAQSSVMSREARGRLAPRARVQADAGSPLPWYERLLARDGWRGLRASQDAMLSAAASARGEALQRAIRQVGLDTTRQVNPMAAIALPAYAKYVARAEEAIARLDLLVLAAAAAGFREEVGRWPASVGELAGRGLDGPEVERLTGAHLASAGARGPLGLTLAVATGEEGRPDEAVTLEVRPPQPDRAARAR